MSRARIIDLYMEESKRPGFHLDLIRKDMESKGLPDDEAKAIVRFIDAKIKEEARIRAANNRANSILLFGTIILLFSLIVSFLSYKDFLIKSDYSIIMYIPFILGIAMVIKGILAKK